MSGIVFAGLGSYGEAPPLRRPIVSSPCVFPSCYLDYYLSFNLIMRKGGRGGPL